MIDEPGKSLILIDSRLKNEVYPMQFDLFLQYNLIYQRIYYT